MTTLQIELADEVVELLARRGRPPRGEASELIVLDLYRRHEVSSGRAAELMGIDKGDFLRRAGRAGIPFIDMTEEELQAEITESRRL